LRKSLAKEMSVLGLPYLTDSCRQIDCDPAVGREEIRRPWLSRASTNATLRRESTDAHESLDGVAGRLRLSGRS
jgi:hypothetical protein